MAWIIGDNSLRNALRLKEGLEVIVNSEFHGDLSSSNEEGICSLLEREGIVELRQESGSAVARKWRLVTIRLGFIHPETHLVTANGRRLIHAQSLPEQEDCFLRALLAHQLPSEIHSLRGRGDVNNPFSPLRMTLEVLTRLEEVGEDAFITKEEMGCILIFHYDMNDVPIIVEEIIDYRRQKREHVGRVNRFVAAYREQAIASRPEEGVGVTSLTSYADVNFRYFKATGLFADEGISRLSIAVPKRIIVEQILAIPYESIPVEEYIETLTRGASLPTDNENEAIVAIRDLHRILVDYNVDPDDLPDNLHQLPVEDLAILRIRFENQWLQFQEREYASRQRLEWEEIIRYLELLQGHRRRPRAGGQANAVGERIRIPQGEAPAYLEWTIWRAFLAINSLRNEPWESRKFTVDREFLPLRHAPGGDADMIFEFDDFVFVVEVTLTTSSRQEAAEGEPVRRHVAQHVDYYAAAGKDVYGIFIANSIDTNTAETFRIGVWYRGDDSHMNVHIVPITLAGFTNIFEALFRSQYSGRMDEFLKFLVIELRSRSSETAPNWKRYIEELVARRVQGLSSPAE
ncbi:AlwI family type II restriction endonuclease [Planococcus sp. CAU13]|uniref:AlwI family type II restriction endonuclease n=1 Tax=Planococcus sp. CAU13 TaxID=1541197 RepID=UPI00052FEB1F|nr:AlwI family type II restriction endonuclease [Planococcus sp. CAU13]